MINAMILMLQILDVITNEIEHKKRNKLEFKLRDVAWLYISYSEIQLLYLRDKHTLFWLFLQVYRGYTVGNGIFLAVRQRSQENGSFQQHNQDIPVGTIQVVYIYPHPKALH